MLVDKGSIAAIAMILVVAVTATACSTTQSPTATLASVPTATTASVPTAAPTNTPTTAPTNAPTAAPTNTPTATPIAPETQASQVEDVVGVWLVKYLLDNAGSAHLEFTSEGTYSIVGISGDANGATIDTGKFRFEEGQLVLEADGGCLDAQGTLIEDCLGIYKVYVTKQGDKPTRVRFAVVDDPATGRKRTLDGKILPLAEP